MVSAAEGKGAPEDLPGSPSGPSSFDNTLGAPEKWPEYFEGGAASSGDQDANILWLSEYLEICKRGIDDDCEEPLRDYNAELQSLLQSRRPGSLRDQLVQNLLEELKDDVAPLLAAIAANPDGTQKTATPQLLTSVRTGDNGVITGTWDCGNVVVHLSTEPSLPGLVCRHASYITSLVEDRMEITAPLCVYMMCQGRRFLVASKLPMREDAGKVTKWVGVRHALGNLAVKLNAPKLLYDPMQVCYGADSRLYVVPGMNMTTNAEYALQHPVCLLGFAAVDSSPAPEQLDRLMLDLHPPAANINFVRDQFRRNGLPLRKMREVYECDMFQNRKYDKVRDLLTVEMVARTLKQIACVEVSENRGAVDEEELFNRYFHTVTDSASPAWAILAPLVAAKFGLSKAPELPDSAKPAAVKYLRHLLGVPFSMQKVTLRSSPLSHQVGSLFLFSLRKTGANIAALEEAYKTRSSADTEYLQQWRLADLYKKQLEQLGVSQRDLLERKLKSVLQKLMGSDQRCPNAFTSGCLLEYVAMETPEPLNGTGSRARVEWNRKRLELIQKAVEMKRKAWPAGEYERVEAGKTMLGRSLIAIELSGDEVVEGILKWVREAARWLSSGASVPVAAQPEPADGEPARLHEMDVFEAHSIILPYSERERIEAVLRAGRVTKRDRDANATPKRKKKEDADRKGGAAATADDAAVSPHAKRRGRSKKKRKAKRADKSREAAEGRLPHGHSPEPLDDADGGSPSDDDLLEPTPLVPPRSATAEPEQHSSSPSKGLPLIKTMPSIRGDKEYMMKQSEKAARTDYNWWHSKHKHLLSKYEKLKRLQQRDTELSEKRAVIAHQQQAISAQMDLNKCLSKQMLLQRKEYIRQVRSARKNAVKDARVRLFTAKCKMREDCQEDAGNNKVTIETLSLMHRQQKTEAANTVKMQRMAVSAAKTEKQMKHEQHYSNVYDEKLSERQQQMDFYQRETQNLVKDTSQLLQKIRELNDDADMTLEG